MNCTATVHGSANAYRNYGCHCTSGVRAHTRAINKWRLRRLRNGGNPLRIDATGARRRLQALARIGFDFTWLEANDGLTRDVTSAVANGRRTTISLDSHRKVVAVYDARYAEDGPSKRAAMRAERAGWDGPWAWDDATIDDPNARPVRPETARIRYRRDQVDTARVDRAVGGERIRLTITERRAVVAELHKAGLNDCSIERRTGINQRTVLRIRDELQLPAIGGNQLAGAA